MKGRVTGVRSPGLCPHKAGSGHLLPARSTARQQQQRVRKFSQRVEGNGVSLRARPAARSSAARRQRVCGATHMAEPVTLDEAGLRDPYEVLGVERDAPPEAIRAAYRKMALKYHPDKVKTGSPEEAAERFKEIATAHSILMDPEKRRKFDLGGFEAMEAADLDVELDVSQMGVAGTAFAAMASRLGMPIKTAVAPEVLRAAYEDEIESEDLRFGTAVSDKVEKHAAKFYTLNVDRKAIEDGFVVVAHSPALSKFKLLLFEQMPDGSWEMVCQEESEKMGRVTAASLIFLHFQRVTIGGVPSSLELAGDMEQALFKRLQSVKKREEPPLKPGPLRIAVYGDNWYKRCTFTLEARLPSQVRADAVSEVQKADQELLARQAEVVAFETTFRNAERQFRAACERHAEFQKATDELLATRERAYLDLLQLNEPVEQSVNAAQAGTGGVSGAASKIFGGLWGSKAGR